MAERLGRRGFYLPTGVALTHQQAERVAKEFKGCAGMNDAVERIYDTDRCLLALIVRGNFNTPGVTFFTRPDFSQQLACMLHPAGKKIDAHIHKSKLRQVYDTQETLILKRGKLRVDFLVDQQSSLSSRTPEGGDVILLICGRRFEVLEDVEMIEVKQGPYAGGEIRFKY